MKKSYQILKFGKENSVLNELNQELNQLKKTTENFEKVLTVIQVINELYQLAQEDKTLQHQKFLQMISIRCQKQLQLSSFRKCLVEKQINLMHS